MVKNWLKKITGVAAIEAAAIEAETKRIKEEEELQRLTVERIKAEEEAELARLSFRLY